MSDLETTIRERNDSDWNIYRNSPLWTQVHADRQNLIMLLDAEREKSGNVNG